MLSAGCRFANPNRHNPVEDPALGLPKNPDH